MMLAFLPLKLWSWLKPHDRGQEMRISYFTPAAEEISHCDVFWISHGDGPGICISTVAIKSE